jgi:DNA-binding transcriptional regulator GbsR (MarR family)
VSYHVKKLWERGLVERTRTVPVRGVKETFFSATTPFVVRAEDAEHMTLDERIALSSWTISLINRDFLQAIEAGTIDERIDRHLTRYPLHLDESGIEDLFQVHDHAYVSTTEIHQASEERLDRPAEEGIPVSSVIASFLLPELPRAVIHGDPPSGIPDLGKLLKAQDVISSTTSILRNGWHPVQIQALIILSEREASPIEIARELGISVGVVSYHVKALLGRGQIELVRTRAVRGANQHFYRAGVPLIVMGEDADRMSHEDRLVLSCWTISRINSDFWQGIQSGTIDERPDRHLTRLPLYLDDHGLEELFALHNKVFFETKEIQRASARRLKKAANRGRAATAILASFPMPRRKVESV